MLTGTIALHRLTLLSVVLTLAEGYKLAESKPSWAFFFRASELIRVNFDVVFASVKVDNTRILIYREGYMIRGHNCCFIHSVKEEF